MNGLAPAPLATALLLLAACANPDGRDPLYSGTIEAVEVDVVPEVSGRILSRPVDQGDRVTKGDTVATIDPEPYRIAVAETEAALAQAGARLALLAAGYRREEVEAAAREVDEAAARLTQAEARVRRIQELREQRIVSPDDLDVAARDRDVALASLQAARARHALLEAGYRPEEIDQARAEVRRLEAQLEQKRLDLERTTVKAAMTGTVTEKLQETGEYARSGSPIATIADLENLYTWVYLTQKELAGIKLGDVVSVRIDGAPGRDFPGKVVYISDEAEFTPKNVQTREDRAQLVFGVKVAVSNPDGTLKVGIPADVVLARPGAG